MSNDYHPDGFVPMQNALVNASVEGFTQMPKEFYSPSLVKMVNKIQKERTVDMESNEQTPQVKPMTQPQMEELAAAHIHAPYSLIRAVERFHGIV